MNTRPEILENAPMQYAPVNEQGVVYIFHQYAKKHRLRVEVIQAAFPDCIAYQKIGGREKRIRIEFEFRSRNFRTQRHSVRGCDWIVCWEHNWPGVPKHLRVIELRQEYGMGFNAWIQPVGDPFKKELSRTKSSEYWSLPSQGRSGDLVLFYHTRPDMCIKDVFVITGPVEHVKAGWKKGKDYMGPIRRVCRLKSPLFLEDMRKNRILNTASFVRGQMLGRPKVTEYWSHLYELIVKRNPSVRISLSKFVEA